MIRLADRIIPNDRTLDSDRVLTADRVLRVDGGLIPIKGIRFIVVGDMHKDLPNTDSTHEVGVHDRTGPPVDPTKFIDRFDLLLNNLERERDKGLNFVLFNGDLKHSYNHHTIDDLYDIRNKFNSNIGVGLFAGYGNHDRVTDDEWYSVFGHRRSHSFAIGDYGFIILNTSTTDGSRDICRDQDFLANAFDMYKDKKGVFVFAHIPRYSGFKEPGTGDSPDCPVILDLFENQENLISVIHSHFHFEDRIFENEGYDNWFTGHVAHYGMPYYGYRIVEISESGTIKTMIYDMTDKLTRSEKVYPA